MILSGRRSRNLNPRTKESKLFDVIAAITQEGDYTVGSTHMSRAGHDKVGLAALQVSLDFRNPFSVAIRQESFRERRKVAELIHHDPSIGISVSSPPCLCDLIARASRGPLRRQKHHQQHRFTLPIS